MKMTFKIYILWKKGFLLCFYFLICFKQLNAQSPITQIAYSANSAATVTETNIKGAGYSFSQWTNAANFTVNYSSSVTDDVLNITSFNVGATNFIPVSPPYTYAQVKRAGNSVITDNRNFITSWNRISSSPATAATSGIFNCDGPKITSMESALLTNNINTGYDNVFNNTTGSPHYNNIERVDYIVPTGYAAISTPNKAGFAIFDRGVGDSFKIAAITSLDVTGNPSGYKTLVTVPISKFSAAGLLGANFNYTIFVSDPLVALGEIRPSTQNSQNIRGVYISLQDLGIAVNEAVYGYSLFGQDVNPALGHVLTNPATFPTNSSFANCLDLVNVNSFFQSGIVILPVKLASFTSTYNKRNNRIDLNWETTLEQGLQNFIIEKSSNGTDWKAIGTVKSSGITNGSNYFFADDKLSSTPKLYYRLKMVNEDGSAQYSGIILQNNTSLTEINLIINDNSLVLKTVIKAKEAHLIDASGKKMQSKKDIKPGADIQFSLNSLASGLYIVLLVDESNTPYSKKFMKL
jgi:hypothetical protein